MYLQNVQPPYASCLLFELYQGTSDPYVQLFYKNTSDTSLPIQPLSLDIPNCGVKCPLKKLYNLYEDVLPTESFEDACKLLENEILPLGGNPENNAL